VISLSHLPTDDLCADAADEGVVMAGVVEERLGAVEVVPGHLVERLQVGLDLVHFLEQLKAVLTK